MLWRLLAELGTQTDRGCQVILAGDFPTDPKPDKDNKPDKKQNTDKKSEKKPEKKAKLTGQELYSIHCGRCHAERYPTEFTASQWKTIALEMRVRANLPAEQAKAVMKYLQEDAGK